MCSHFDLLKLLLGHLTWTKLSFYLKAVQQLLQALFIVDFSKNSALNQNSLLSREYETIYENNGMVWSTSTNMLRPIFKRSTLPKNTWSLKFN